MELTRTLAKALDDAALPLASVLLVVRNESRYIERCIAGLADQDYPRSRLEVILLDGLSTDDTVTKAQAVAAESGLDLRVEANPGLSAASGFNRGLATSRGEIIVKADGHARLAPDFISAGVRALEESGADAVGGRIRTIGEGVAGRAIALAMSSPFGVGDAAFRHAGEAPRAEWVDSVPFAAYRRSAFERAGVFAEDIEHGEDDEFNYRLREAGGRLLLSPDIHSDYFCRGSFAALWRQYWRYGRAKAAVLRRHPGRLRPRHLVPSAFLLSLLLGSMATLIDRRLAVLPAAAGAAYLATALVASLRIARRGAWRESWLLPPAFACIHFAAGAGMLAGLIGGLARRQRRIPVAPARQPEE